MVIVSLGVAAKRERGRRKKKVAKNPFCHSGLKSQRPRLTRLGILVNAPIERLRPCALGDGEALTNSAIRILGFDHWQLERM